MKDNNSKELPLKGELLRKSTHLFAIVIPAGYYFLGLTKGEFLAIMIPVSIIMIIIDVSRLRDWSLWHLVRKLISPMVRSSETSGDFTGATYILSTVCFTAAFYSKPVAAAALAFIIVGDPASALIGRRYGKHRFKNKSLEGSLAFLVPATIVGIFAPELPVTVGILGAIVATVTEAVSFKVDDNTTVPLISGLVMTLALKIFYS